MLTNDDLQAIKGIVKNEVDPLKKTLEEHGTILKSHSKLLKSHSKILHSLKKDQDTMLNMLDREQMNQGKRLKKVEEHLGFSSTSF